MADGMYDEFPARWTGNGSRNAKPDFNDWYETVKINFGVSPEGKKDFTQLPHNYISKDYKAHYKFWLDKDIPDTWKKFREIVFSGLTEG